MIVTTQYSAQPQFLTSTAADISLNTVLFQSAPVNNLHGTTVTAGFPIVSHVVSPSVPVNHGIEVNSPTMTFLPTFLQEIASQGLSHAQQQVIHQQLQQQQQPAVSQASQQSQHQQPQQQQQQQLPALQKHPTSPLAELNVHLQAPVTSTPIENPGFVLTQSTVGAPTPQVLFTAPQTQPSGIYFKTLCII